MRRAARMWPQLMTHTQVERSLLHQLADSGGRLSFKSTDASPTTLRVFEVGAVAPLLSLQDKQLVVVERESVDLRRLVGNRVRVASIAAELTHLGWGEPEVSRVEGQG